MASASITVANHGGASAAFTSGEVILRDDLPEQRRQLRVPQYFQPHQHLRTRHDCLRYQQQRSYVRSQWKRDHRNTRIVRRADQCHSYRPRDFWQSTRDRVCAADPGSVIAETNELNNNCSDAVSVTAADLQLQKIISSGSTESGSNVTYLITVTNSGPNAANNVVVTDNLPANVTFVSCAASTGTCTGGVSVTANLGSLANGAQATVTIVAKINCNVANGAPIGNTASVASSTGDPNPANNSSAVSLNASNPVPIVNASVAVSSLAQNNHELINAGLAATASDGACPAPATFTVQVFGDEDDQTPTATNEVYSPDAKDIAVGTLRLRSERVSSGDGRVYLVVVKATDAAGGVGFATTTVVVPKSTSAANITSVNSQAAAAMSFANSHNGNPPAGYFVIGDGPVIGQKQ